MGHFGMVKKKPRPLPFRMGFILGILLVFIAKLFAGRFDEPWILYVGVVLGGGLCVIDIFRALKQMD